MRRLTWAAIGLLAASTSWGQATDTLNAWTAETNSGTYDGTLGDRYAGPGILTMGRVGAKKQVVVPPGRWLLLSLQDHPAASGAADLTSLSFGHFNGRQLAALLRVTLNKNVTAVTDWSTIDPCARDAASPLRRVVSLPSAVRGECQLVLWQADAGLDTGADSAMLRNSLAKLGATVPRAPVLSSTLLFRSRLDGVRRAQRLDWPAAAGQGGGGAAGADAWLAWFDRYRAAVETGFRYSHRIEDLEPSIEPRPASTLALDAPPPAR